MKKKKKKITIQDFGFNQDEELIGILAFRQLLAKTKPEYLSLQELDRQEPRDAHCLITLELVTYSSKRKPVAERRHVDIQLAKITEPRIPTAAIRQK